MYLQLSRRSALILKGQFVQFSKERALVRRPAVRILWRERVFTAGPEDFDSGSNIVRLSDLEQPWTAHRRGFPALRTSFVVLRTSGSKGRFAGIR
jgi:hypothetical protein